MTNRSDLDRLVAAAKDALVRAELPDAREHPGAFTSSRNAAEAGSHSPAAVSASGDALVEQFSRELVALSGHVHRVAGSAEAVAVVLDIVRSLDASRVLAWDAASPLEAAVARELEGHGVGMLRLDLARDLAARKQQLADLDAVQVGLTGARAALADTGSVVVVSGAGRSRLASLLPPVHVVLIERDDLYPSLPAFLEANPGVAAEGSNVVIITGPSRTADIEMTLSWGVHGPKHVHAVLVNS